MPYSLICILSVFVLTIATPQYGYAETQDISVLSWNVWFNDASGNERYPEILNTIDSESPEIIFLQEITPRFISIIKKHPILKQYHFSASHDALRSYGQAFLTRKRLLLKSEYTLTSKYGRHALFGLYQVNPQQAFILINVHLESGLFESSARETQVRQITSNQLNLFKAEAQETYPDLKNIDVIWAGDFNMGYTEFTDGFEGFIDSAKVFEDNTPTYHVNNNKLANYTASLFEDSARLDRVLISKNAKIELKQYQVLNNSSFAELSDHYPVIVNIGLTKFK